MDQYLPENMNWELVHFQLNALETIESYFYFRLQESNPQFRFPRQHQPAAWGTRDRRRAFKAPWIHVGISAVWVILAQQPANF